MNVQPIRLVHFDGSTRSDRDDCVAVEEPLEIRLVHGPAANRSRTRLTVTLRTPGHDDDLAMGLLVSEGLIAEAGEVLGMESKENILRVELAPDVDVKVERLGRTFASTASCGLCGRTMLDALEEICEPVKSNLAVPLAVIQSLPRTLREAQPSFERTGGLHAAGLFDGAGNLHAVREDVGRHNAVDKVLGASLGSPLGERILLVSGRAGFELVQKAARFGVPVMVAVGAPTSLAVELAQRTGVTLIGFLRDEHGNIYTHPERLAT